MNFSSHDSRSRQPGHSLALPPTVRVLVHGLSTLVTHFDLFAILPPHVEPLALDFNHGPTSLSARFSFAAVDQALVLWIHARELFAAGHLKHLSTSGCEPLRFDVDPPIERLLFNFEAAKTAFPDPPRDPVPFVVHIPNLNLTTSPDDIRALIPTDLQPHVLGVHMHDLGPLLSPPFPEPGPAKRLVRVGRATVAFDSMQNALAMFKQLHGMRQAGELNRLRHFGAKTPFALDPTLLHLMMQARAKLGDHALQALLSAAMDEPTSSPVLRSTRLGASTPAPSSWSSSSSTRSKTPSPTRTLSLAPPPPQGASVHPPSPTLAHRSFPTTVCAGAMIRRPPQPSPAQLYAADQSPRPFVPRHYVVSLENLSPHTPASFFDWLAESFAGTPPFETLVSRESFTIVLAFERVATRSVDYSFHSVQDADAFVQHIRGLDRRREMDQWKAAKGCRVSIYQKIAEGSETVGW